MSRKKNKREKQKLLSSKKIPSISPFDNENEIRKAAKYYQLGQLEKAEKIYRRILQIHPNHAVSLHLLGVISIEVGNYDFAVKLISKAIENEPQNPVFMHSLGKTFHKQGKLDAAISCYEKAVELRPDYVEAILYLGIAFQNQRNFDEAISCYEKAVELRPDYVEALNNMGTAFHKQGKLDAAISCYQKAVKLRPDYVKAIHNLGTALHNQGNLDEAISCYEKAVELRPDYVEALNNMGAALHNQGKLDEALFCFRKALQINPDPGTEIRICLSLPVISESQHSIEQHRRRIVEEIESLEHKGLTLDDPHKQVGSVGFYLAYHGLDDKQLQEKIASFYIKVCPKLVWTPVAYHKQQLECDKINIGLISENLYDHTIGNLNLGIIRNLSRDKFRVKLFRFPSKEDHVSRAINKAADEVAFLPNDLIQARQRVVEHSLDILFYLDVGMEPLTYFLAFSRLAPVQCVTWGHPVTTGIPNMDYFISSEDAEPPDADDHYSERLVRLKRFAMYCYHQETFVNHLSARDFDLPEDYNLYVCPQMLFKFHPEFDTILGDILRQDPHGLIVLNEGKHRYWAKLLRDRFVNVFPEEIDRVRFLPWMPFKEFLSLLRIADVLLDTPHFNGGYTNLLAFGYGVPIVTLPGEFMRGRLTLAMYKQMGIMDCVAGDEGSYVNIALRLANDKSWREELTEKIKVSAGIFFEDMEAVHELESFFEWAVGKARK